MRHLRREFRPLSIALGIAALSSTAHAATGNWTNGDANNVWQDNNNWSATPFPGNTTNVFTSTDAATFSTTGSGTITLGGTGIINVQNINFGVGTGNANAFVIGASTDTLSFTGSATNAAGGVFVGTGVTASEQIGVAGTTINVSPTNTNFNNASTTAGVTLTIAGNIAQPGTTVTNLFFGADGANGTGGLVNVTGTINNTSTVALPIFKRDLNTATLAGAVTTGNGAISVRGGVLNLGGTVNTGTAGINVTQGNGGSSLSATLNVTGGSVTALNMSIGQGLTTVTGAFYQTAGTVTLTQAANATNLQIGAVATPAQNNSGYFRLSGGSFTSNEFDVAGNFAASVGVMDVTGGTATSNGYITVGRGTTTSSGVLNITGGTVVATATAANGPIALNWTTTAGGLGVLNVGGGSGTATLTGGAGTTQTAQFAGKGLNLAESTVAGTQGIANLLTNGTLTVTDVVASQSAAPTSHLNFNGGTLKATATNLGATFINSTGSANITAINVYSGGGTIDNSGTNITIGHTLVAPVGQGVSATSVAVPSGGSGYIGAPLVKLTGGTGVGATGYATITNGVVTGIVITSPGIGYTAGDTLTATFFGGVGNGGTAATNVTGIAVAANVSGGLAFVGSGTTTLSAANTYTGTTTVSGGILQLAATGSLASNTVSVTGAGTLTLQGTATLADNSILRLVSGTTLNLSAASGSETIGSLVLNGRGVAPGTYSATQLSGLDANITFSSAGETLTVTTAIPEPSVWAIMLVGIVGCTGRAVRRKRCA